MNSNQLLTPFCLIIFVTTTLIHFPAHAEPVDKNTATKIVSPIVPVQTPAKMLIPKPATQPVNLKTEVKTAVSTTPVPVPVPAVKAKETTCSIPLNPIKDSKSCTPPKSLVKPVVIPSQPKPEPKTAIAPKPALATPNVKTEIKAVESSKSAPKVNKTVETKTVETKTKTVESAKTTPPANPATTTAPTPAVEPPKPLTAAEKAAAAEAAKELAFKNEIRALEAKRLEIEAGKLPTTNTAADKTQDIPEPTTELIEQVLSTLTVDWNQDKLVDSVVLLKSGSAADLYFYFANDKGDIELKLHKKNLVWAGAKKETQPSLSLQQSENQPVLVVNAGNGTQEHNRWQQRLSIGYRDNDFIVTHYSYDAQDSLNPKSALSCEINLLTGEGVRDKKPFKIAGQKIKLSDWASDKTPSQCRS